VPVVVGSMTVRIINRRMVSPSNMSWCERVAIHNIRFPWATCEIVEGGAWALCTEGIPVLTCADRPRMDRLPRHIMLAGRMDPGPGEHVGCPIARSTDLLPVGA
jgi:hypothetical protein